MRRIVTSSYRSVRVSTPINNSNVAVIRAISTVLQRQRVAGIPTNTSIPRQPICTARPCTPLDRPSRAMAAVARREANDVGIHAIDIYFPQQFVDQNDLETHDKVSKGKYTIGLGQSGLAFVNEREDIYSICLTAVATFMKKHNIPYTAIGRLEVGTETMLDHSKSVKSVLMQLFAESGNTDVEGIDTYNACYGGTAALFNSAAWVESRAWDGRLALVVSADIAEYAPGIARPTGGCGAVVMLVGPDAPLVLEAGQRASHFEHAYDFFKPNMSSPYPVVDGAYSNTCYIRSLDTCYQRLANRVKTQSGTDLQLSQFNHALFHAPYNKLTQKAFARLLYNDFVRDPTRAEFVDNKAIQEFKGIAPETTYENRALEKEFGAIASKAYAEKVGPATLLPQHLGNMYTASLYAGLLSLIHNRRDALAGNRLLMFSYGSGLAASLFTIRVPDTRAAREQLIKCATIADITARLAARTKVTPEVFNATMASREALHHVESAWSPSSSVSHLLPGTHYLTRRDAMGRRFYDIASSTSSSTAAAAAPSSA